MALKEPGRRLAAIASLVRTGSRVADIGTDHGILITYLVITGKATSGYACDIREMPLEKARKAIAEEGLEESISCLLCDGLSALAAEMVDDIVIAGMGGDLISHILADAPWVKNERLHLLLQPMTKPEKLRTFLSEEGFLIEKELAVRDSGRYYTIMSVCYDGDVRHCDSFYSYSGELVQDDSPEATAYLVHVLERLQKKADGLEAGGSAIDAETVRDTCTRLEKEIERRRE